MENNLMTVEKDYVLGTHDEEIERLGLQHRVWRPRALDAWRRAGITVGQTIVDVGCGPGYAAFDLADIVGEGGRIIAVDRSRRFLDALEAKARNRGNANITTVELDLDEGDLMVSNADAVWCRWVFSFVKKPYELLNRIRKVIRTNGIIVLHEYLDYSTWRLAPRCTEVEDFVGIVMRSWRDNGGEPDIGLSLPSWLQESGFIIKELHPIVDIVSPSNFVWQWPKTYLEVNIDRMRELGYIDAVKAQRVRKAFRSCETDPKTLMITPVVLEIIAGKRG